MRYQNNHGQIKITMTEPEAYQMRTVLNQTLRAGFGSINDIQGKRKGDRVCITIEGLETPVI